MSDADRLVSSDRRYPLGLDQTAVERYRMLAEQARAAEADLWQPAGIVAGAQVADVGCGPGAMLAALAAAGLGNVTVRQGRAEETGLVAGSLAVVMLRHVLAHNGGAEDAIVAH